MASTRFFDDIYTIYCDRTCERPVHAGEAAHERGFARAVRANQGRDSVGLDRKTNLVQRAQPGVFVNQAGSLNHVDTVAGKPRGATVYETGGRQSTA